MDSRRYHFFCPQLKGDASCQTIQSNECDDHFDNLEEKLHFKTVNSLLMGEKNYRNPVQQSIQQGYSKYIGFMKAVYDDERFDVLTSSEKFINESDAKFHFEFFDDLSKVYL